MISTDNASKWDALIEKIIEDIAEKGFDFGCRLVFDNQTSLLNGYQPVRKQQPGKTGLTTLFQALCQFERMKYVDELVFLSQQQATIAACARLSYKHMNLLAEAMKVDLHTIYEIIGGVKDPTYRMLQNAIHFVKNCISVKDFIK